jgi:uncharacterized protein YndB with AHSA1/START domain
MHIETSTVIARPAADVFAVLSDYRRDTQWRPAVTAMSVEPDAPVTVGSRITEELRFAGQSWVTPTVVTDLRPGRLLAFQGGDATMAIRGGREVQATGEHSTTVRQWLDISLRGPLRVLQPILAARYRRVAADDLQRLRALLEAAPAPLAAAAS